MKLRSMIATGFVLLLMPGARGQEAQPEQTLKVKLLAPLSSKFSRKGDMVSAQVLEPGSMQGILEGGVREIRSEAASTTIQFDFHTLHTANGNLPVSAVLINLANSRQQGNVDENGVVLDLAPRAGKAGGLGRIGSMGSKVTGLFNRSSGTGGVKLTVKGPSLAFAPGTEFVLSVKQPPTK